MLLVLEAFSVKPSGQMARLEGLLSILFKRLNHSKGEVYMPLTKDAESTLIFVCFVLFPSLRRDLDMLFVGD